ncbi:MAG: hypothetical protein HQL01_14905 [Nitrospirae bacterium]|nr:hypothetical protein [Nitrospirota bacterium]
MTSEPKDRDPMDDEPRRYEMRKDAPIDGDDMKSMGGGPLGSGPLGRGSVDMVKLFARYKAGDFNEKAAREVAEVFRELSDATVSIKTGDSNEPPDEMALKEDFFNVREDFSDLKEDFYGLKDDYYDLKDDYFSLKDSYYNLKDEYLAVKSDYLKLKELYAQKLDEEREKIRTTMKSMRRKVRIYFLLLLILVLLSTPPSMDILYKFFGLQ